MDADNLDFRPTQTSDLNDHNAGPYIYDPKATKYWIPGRQVYKTCTPVPPDGSTTVKADRDALIWLNGHGAKTHHLCIGTDRSAVKEATPESPEYKGSIPDDGNIYYLKDDLQYGEEYFWRVDAQVDQDTLYKGDVWAFTVMS